MSVPSSPPIAVPALICGAWQMRKESNRRRAAARKSKAHAPVLLRARHEQRLVKRHDNLERVMRLRQYHVVDRRNQEQAQVPA